ncbi:YdiU family protein [Pseudonocardia sp. KRD291]|uniref:protein adenylyltransferase SelO n=1 Tax=Pseudonocardia sp. KRD291 TaxID=2792007 RepID=UPI001C49D70F|nr:YdiU family protein [Pseudonocardia sp. KRD291]MBW0103811.1 YdiU family protein [Pseudonocardia sp. KRD291]
MTVAVGTSFTFDNTYVRELEGLYQPWTAAPAPAPRLVALNEELAAELGLDAGALRSPEGVDVLVGNTVPGGAQPVAQVYSGHQFGNYSPRLGDGRALLLGELHDRSGNRRDLHLKGSGRTPFARGGDGKAPLGPMLREYVIGEAMHALGIPTTRALAVVATGEDVARDRLLPGAVLSRVASSHLRVGTFQYTAALGDPAQDDTALLRRLADHAIARHHPDAAAAANPYLTLFERVLDTQASLVARWMLVGFVHGVMNTDNMTISGETIDYGPCAFLDVYDPATVFSSIDEAGRYAFGNQPRVAQWNLARLAEALLPLIDTDQDAAVAAATEVLTSFQERYDRYWRDGMRAKLGLTGAPGRTDPLIDDLPALLAAQRVDFTAFHRSLSSAVRGDDAPMRSLLTDPSALDEWTSRWKAALATAGEPGAVADAMDRVNPVYIPRNQHVEEALTAATAGDTAPFERLLDVLAHPFDERPGLEAYAAPAPPEFGSYTTFCGT